MSNILLEMFLFYYWTDIMPHPVIRWLTDLRNHRLAQFMESLKPARSFNQTDCCPLFYLGGPIINEAKKLWRILPLDTKSQGITDSVAVWINQAFNMTSQSIFLPSEMRLEISEGEGRIHAGIVHYLRFCTYAPMFTSSCPTEAAFPGTFL